MQSSRWNADALLSDLSNRPLGIGDDFRGISGAGAQDKLIACIKDGNILLPLNGTPSTHIIKPGIERFPESVIFNFLIGNGDAHGKNFSVLYRTRAPRLAPVYDALCTTIYPSIAKKMAMKFDGKFEFRWVTPGKIVRTFARTGIGEKVIFDSIARQITALRKNIPDLSDQAEHTHPSPVYHDIIRGIHARISQLEANAHGA